MAGYLNDVVLIHLVHFRFKTVWSPYLLEKDKLGRDILEEIAEIEVVSGESFYIECKHTNV